MKERLLLFTVPLVILSLIAIPTIYTIASYNNTNTYTVTVADKETKKNSDSSKYLVFTKLENGEVKVFEITDALFAWRFNSSDIYAEMDIGETYEIRTIGFRIPFLSTYENIMEFERVGG